MQRRDDGRILAQLAPEELRENRSREVVGGRAQSTGRDHATGPLQRLAHGVGDLVGIIAHGGTARDRDTDFAQRAREEHRVGVDRRAKQEFITDGDDLDGFSHELWLGGSARVRSRRGRDDAAVALDVESE